MDVQKWLALQVGNWTMKIMINHEPQDEMVLFPYRQPQMLAKFLTILWILKKKTFRGSLAMVPFCRDGRLWRLNFSCKCCKVILDLAWNMTASTKKYEGSSNESLAC
jgi:hypothetical protein